MEGEEYARMYELETIYWWFRALHGIVLDTLRGIGVGPSSRILDAGCGTGQNLVNLARAFHPTTVAGFDASHCVPPFWARRGLRSVCLGSVNEIPFRDSSFDVAAAISVLEGDTVGVETACRELLRVVKTGGHLVLVLSAHKWLSMKSHRRQARGSRRFSKQDVLGILHSVDAKVLRFTYLFASFLPALACYRWIGRWIESRPGMRPRSELRPLPAFLNRLFLNVALAERQILRRWDLPFGSSILAVVRKLGS